MNGRNVFWWVSFFFIGISLQNMMPGLDVLVIGLLIALQERRSMQLTCLIPVLILIQEGSGSLAFGASVLWYASIIVLFFMGHWLFTAENMLFMFMLSAFMGLSHLGIMHGMSALQSTPLNAAIVLDESVLQALFIACTWHLIAFTRRIVVLEHENPS